MKRVVLNALVLALMFLAACAGASVPPATVLPTAIPPTSTSLPTAAPAVTAEPTLEPTTEPTATEEPTPEPTATDEPTAQPTATAEPSPQTTEPPTGAALPGNAAITIEDFRFEPVSVTVRIGSIVTWTHVGNARHTVTADDGSFDSGNLSSLETFDFTFSTAGTYAYYCRLHGGPGQEGMSAVITVTD